MLVVEVVVLILVFSDLWVVANRREVDRCTFRTFTLDYITRINIVAGESLTTLPSPNKPSTEEVCTLLSCQARENSAILK